MQLVFLDILSSVRLPTGANESEFITEVFIPLPVIDLITAVLDVSHMTCEVVCFTTLWLTVNVAVTPDTLVYAVKVVVVKSLSLFAVIVTLEPLTV